MNVVERILRYHKGRDPDRVALKYQLIAASPAAFFRGTANLFYEDLAAAAQIPMSPLAWITGDAHLENFGVYKGDNRLVYFDFNDFDEATLAPVLDEILRMLTSIYLTADGALAERFLAEYAIELGEGKPRWVERATARGAVRNLVYSLKGRTRKQLLQRRTVLKGKTRQIRVDGEFALPLLPGDWERLQHFVRAFGDQIGRRAFFDLHSAARRIAGNGSLGIGRFILLVEGKGSPDHNFLLDLKQARPSVIAGQSAWRTDAERIVTIQRRVQAIAPAFLHAVDLDGDSYVLRELVPGEDRVRLNLYAGQRDGLEQVVVTEANVMAWAQLRASGRQGSANADELIAFGQDFSWHGAVLAYARDYAERVKRDWGDFAKALAAGLLPQTKKLEKAAKGARPPR